MHETPTKGICRAMTPHVRPSSDPVANDTIQRHVAIMLDVHMSRAAQHIFPMKTTDHAVAPLRSGAR